VRLHGNKYKYVSKRPRQLPVNIPVERESIAAVALKFYGLQNYSLRVINLSLLKLIVEKRENIQI